MFLQKFRLENKKVKYIWNQWQWQEFRKLFFFFDADDNYKSYVKETQPADKDVQLSLNTVD